MNNYYVYKHIGHSGVLYVGKGKSSRAWSTARTNVEHSRWLEDRILDGSIGEHVVLVHTGLSSKQAYTLESDMIAEYSPPFNAESHTLTCPECGFTSTSGGGMSSHMRNTHKDI